ncbi:e9imm peptide [Polymorphospora lycopeni]|uniref:E9imm peptide n=1 Tax=Polymorphospora lycopeni TaxID=3140240 RepID=A0ABV5CII5_9ACTN
MVEVRLETGDDGRSGMGEGLTRDQVIVLVERIMNGEYADDEELDRWLDRLARDLVCPSVADLIFWPPTPLSAAEVVERALAYQPIRTQPPQ